jgi:hypothetical protein
VQFVWGKTIKVTGQKEMTAMKYETPQLTTLTPAINAIQSTSASKGLGQHLDINPLIKEEMAAYQDWE